MNPDTTPSSTPSANSFGGFTSLYKKYLKAAAIVIALVIIAALGVVSFALLPSWQKKGISSSKEPAYLQIVKVSPTGTVKNAYEPFVIDFNLPVTVHHAEEFIEIFPPTTGSWAQGKDAKQIVFTPTTPYPAGSPIHVRLKTGLPSDAGKKLQEEHLFSFSLIRPEGDAIAFKEGDFAGKFLSFDRSHGAVLDVEVGGSVVSPKVKIFKVAPSLLLQSLTYQVEGDPQESLGYGTYTESPIDTSTLDPVQEITTIATNPHIDFRPDTGGLFLFQGISGDKVVGSVWVSLSDIGVHFRQDDEGVTLAAQNFQTGEEVGDVSVQMYMLKDSPQLLKAQTISGITKIPLPYPNRLDLVVGQKGDETMIIPVAIPNSQAEIRLRTNLASKAQIFLYTDRPIYRPGAAVAFRGVVRMDNDGLYTIPSSGKIRAFINVYNGSVNNTIEQVVDIHPGGIFSGQFTIPSGITSGTLYLYATTNLDASRTYADAFAYFDVREYIKPPFGLDSGASQPEYTRGDAVQTTFKGSYFDGRPLANEHVTLTIFKRDYYETEKAVYNSSFKLNGWGGMCGGGFGSSDDYFGEQVEEHDVVLDKDGNGSFTYPTAGMDTVLSQELTFVVSKKDEHGNDIVSAKNVVLHQGEFNTFFRPGPSEIANGNTVTTKFYTESRSGEKVANKAFTYEVYEEKWENTGGTGASKATKVVLHRGTVVTDGSGIGTFSQAMSTDTDKTLFIAVLGKDDRGNMVEARKLIFVSRSPGRQYVPKWGNPATQTFLRITSNKSNLTPGETAELEIESPENIVALVTFERGRVYQPQWLKITKGTNTYTFPVKDEFMPSITPTFSFFSGGNFYIEGLSLNVPALRNVLTVAISMDKPRYVPGDNATVSIHVSDAEGKPVVAKLGIGVVDKAIFALKKNATLPMHSSFYFFRPRSTNSSSSLTWIGAFNFGGGGGGGGGGGSQFQKDSDTLYWNPDNTTNTDGSVSVTFPVGNAETTWRILTYASTDNSKFGQGEFDFLVAK